MISSSNASVPDAASQGGETRTRAGRILAFVLALLILAALVAWSTMPRTSPQPGGRIQATLEMGNLTLTTTQSVIRCVSVSNGGQGGGLYVWFAYRLANRGDTGIAMAVIIMVDGSTVAEHPYQLAPQQVVTDAIGVTVAYEGSCRAPVAGLGMSVQHAG